jgi:DNA-binding winged helix-turn-helix (wHTH) protein
MDGMAVFRFASYELDPAARELRRDGEVQPLQPKAFDLLAHLIRNRHRAVAREEILRVIWPDVRVTPASVSRALKSARRALGDDGRRQALIRTQAGGCIRFVGEVAVAEGSPPGHRESGRYVGRQGMLLRLRERLTAACAGRGGVLLLVGEPGIGKTRTAGELLEWAAGEGADTVVVHAQGGQGLPPFWPWRGVLARLLPGEPAAPTELPAHASGDGRLWLFDALRRALARAASRAPLVMLLDDLHEADEASVSLLDALLPDVAAQPVLVVGTLRSEETSARPAVAAAFAALARRPQVERLAIPALDAAESAALAARCAGAPLAQAEVARLAELTGGNPLWIEEVLRGALDRGGARLGAPDLLGASLERTIAARLAGLPRAVQRWLEAAAVLGAAFDPSLAARVGGVSPRATRSALRTARTRRLLAPEDPAAPAVARFAHPLFRQVLFQRLAAAEREALHARAAEALEALGDAAPVEAVAEHLLAAGEAVGAAQAAGWGARAGALAERDGAFERAAALYERSLRRTGDGSADPKAACELAIALARTRRRLGDDAAAEPAARAMHWAHRRRWPRLYAEAALAFAGPMDGYRLPKAEITGALADALAALGPDNRDLRARIVARQAAEECFLPDGGRRATLAREAMEVARSTGDVLLEAEVADTPFAGIFSGLAAEELRGLADRLLRFGEDARREGVVLLARLLRLHDRLADADVAGFDAELARADELARELGDPVAAYRIQLWAAARALVAGDAARSEAIALGAFAMAGHGRYEGAAGFLGAQLVLARADQGRLKEGLPLLVRDAELRPGPSSRCFLAWAYAAVEDADACRGILREIAARDLPTLDRFSWCAANASMLSRACWFAEVGAPGPLLETFLARGKRRVAVRGGITAHGPVAWAQALLAALRGDAAAARPLFDEALGVAQSMGATPWVAQIARDRERSGVG